VIVADASALLEVLLNSAAAPVVRGHLFAPQQTIHVPHLADLEVAQVLRRHANTTTMGPARARLALQDYMDLPLFRYPHHVLLARIWDLRRNATAYDAAYLALAEALDAPLITCDRAMAAVHGHRATVLLC